MIRIFKQNGQYFGKIHDIERQVFVGKNGISVEKAEGDNITPAGIFGFQDLYYRADRLTPKEQKIVQNTSFIKHKITQQCGWSDDPNDAAYNQYVTLPHAYSHEKLWMESSCYDVFLVIGYNTTNITLGKGSAIFMHMIDAHKSYTQGCIAFQREDFFEILQHMSSKTQIQIGEIQ